MILSELSLMLAQASPPEPSAPLGWVTGFVVSVLGAILGPIIAWKKGQAAGASAKKPEDETTSAEIPQKRTYSPPTFWQHRALEQRVSAVEANVKDLQNEASQNFLKLLAAGEERQNRLMDKMDKVKDDLNKRIDSLKHP